MTKKDYILIGETLKRIYNDPDVGLTQKQYNEIVLNMGVMLQKDNPRFDGPRFVNFCNTFNYVIVEK